MVQQYGHQYGSSIYYDSGNVGVGVTDPQSDLHVEGTGNTELLVKNKTSGRALINLITENDESSELVFGQNDNANGKYLDVVQVKTMI